MRLLLYYSLLFFLVSCFYRCTYDSDPPEKSEIHDEKPLLLLNATGLPPRRLVRIQYTDATGAHTLATDNEKTDSDGRFLYPLFMQRGTRNYSVTLSFDDSANGVVGDTGDKATPPQTGAFTADGEIVTLPLAAGAFNITL